jgi:hypothetical protein
MMSDLEKRVLDEIVAKNLTPKPAILFLAKRSVFWSLALFSVLLGGISTAIMLFVISDYFETGWRVLDNIHYNETLFVVPVLWLLFLAVFIASAIFGLRHTRHGHRLRTSIIATLACAASLGLGIVLFSSNTAHLLHEYLEANLPAYRSLTYVPFAEWSRPDQGYLGGTVQEIETGGTIKLMDFKDKTWVIDVSEAIINLEGTPLEAGDIAVEGERTGGNTFHARKISDFD